MDIKLIRGSKTPLYLQIKNSIKRMILEKEIFHGFKLPSERFLAKQLNVHRNTVIKAYGELIAEDMVISSTRPRGYFVTYGSMDLIGDIQNKKIYNSFDYMVRDEYSNMNSLFSKLFVSSIKGNIISFAADIAPEDIYPKKELNEIIKDLINKEKYDLYGYCDPQGLEVLRSNIVHILNERQINAKSSEIQIVSETYQALDYVLKLFITTGDTIFVEEPIIPDSYNFFKLMGVNIVTIPVDGNGMIVDCLEQLILKYKPKFIYTIPTFHNPTMTVMSLERRYKLLEYSYKYGIPIIEEDCDCFLQYEGIRLPSLKAIDKHEMVIYIDSFIFSVFPGSRIGYVVAPREVVTKLSRLLEINQIFVNSIGQYVISEFIERGYYKEHIKILRDYYLEKRDIVCNSLKKIDNFKLEFDVPHGGTCIWCKLPDEINQNKLLLNAIKNGILFAPGFLFYPYGNKGEDFIRLSYGNCSKDEIKKGIHLLKVAMQESIE